MPGLFAGKISSSNDASPLDFNACGFVGHALKSLGFELKERSFHNVVGMTMQVA